MPIGNIITLGIGTPSGVPPFITLGLDIGTAVVVPTTPGKAGLGAPFTMSQNVPYILPSQICTIFTTDVGATIQQSNTLAFTNSVGVTLTNGSATVCGAYIRCTSGDITAILKAG